MPNAGKKPADAPSAPPAPPFEEAMKQLESIVEAMESGELPLEKLLEQYEAGARLARACQDKLEEAGHKIQQLEQDAAGQWALKTAELPAGAD